MSEKTFVLLRMKKGGQIEVYAVTKDKEQASGWEQEGEGKKTEHHIAVEVPVI